MKQNTKIILISTASTAVIGALIWAACVLNYGKPKFAQDDLDMARTDLEMIQETYAQMYDNIVENTPGRAKIAAELDSIYTEIENGNTSPKLAQRAGELSARESQLVSDQLNNSASLNTWGKHMYQQMQRVEKLQRDSAICDSINCVPMKQRFSKNLNRMRVDHHKRRMLHHRQKLNQLQK